MTIGIPKEIKNGETRVSMTPALAARCTRLGAKVLVQKNAGLTAGYTDAEYAAAGAKLIADARTIWKNADLIIKVKEPLPSEYPLIQKQQTLFTYLHLAAEPQLAKTLLQKQVLGIAYETIEARDGTLPLLKPMSHIAGRLSIQIGAHYLQSQLGGSGILLGGVPGTQTGNVAIIGAGNSGAHACRMAVGMGARVTILDLDQRKLEHLDTEYNGRVMTLAANPANIAAALAQADLVIGAVLIPGAKAPVVVTKEMLRPMRPGSVLVDIAIDQGGCMQTIRPTSHKEPTYRRQNIIHYAVPNMPAMVGRTSSLALTQATEPYIINFIQNGIQPALAADPGLAKGINTQNGQIPNQAVAQALRLTK